MEPQPISSPRTGVTGQFEAIRLALDSNDKTPEQLLAIRARLIQETEAVNARLRGRLITPEQAREILGTQLFFGADSASKLYGTNLTEEAVAKLPFNLTEAEALNAKRLGHTIALHVPVSMLDLNKHIAKTQNKRKTLFNTDWYKNETFANTPDVLEWRETSVKPVPGTFSKDYLQQTELLIRYVKQEMYKDTQYEEAIREFKEKKPEIQPLIDNWDGDHPSGRKNWYVASEMLANLKITQLTRPTPVSTLQDITNLKSVGANMLENNVTWTSARNSVGGLVDVGHADSNGAIVYGWRPYSRNGDLGASFSRSLRK